ncbi:MAG: hypothetical protein ACI84D_003511, partial [Thalassolituus oleivorans]
KAGTNELTVRVRTGGFEIASLAFSESSQVGTESGPDSEVADAFGLNSIFPNPAGSGASLEVSFQKPGPLGVSVFDMTGRVVASVPASYLAAGTHVLQLPVAGLSAGPYLVRVTAGSQTESRILALTRRP